MQDAPTFKKEQRDQRSPFFADQVDSSQSEAEPQKPPSVLSEDIDKEDDESSDGIMKVLTQFNLDNIENEIQ